MGGGEPGRRGKLDGVTGKPKGEMCMSQLEYRKAYSLDDLISKLMGGYTLDNFLCIQRNMNHLLEQDLVCYLEGYPVIMTMRKYTLSL